MFEVADQTSFNPSWPKPQEGTAFGYQSTKTYNCNIVMIQYLQQTIHLQNLLRVYDDKCLRLSRERELNWALHVHRSCPSFLHCRSTSSIVYCGRNKFRGCQEIDYVYSVLHTRAGVSFKPRAHAPHYFLYRFLLYCLARKCQLNFIRMHTDKVRSIKLVKHDIN